MDREQIRWLLDRGIAPTIETTEDYVEAAKRIRDEGGPVIALESAGGLWPYESPGGDSRVDPVNFEPWRRAADALRERLRRFRDAGVALDAAWFDYENAPVNLQLADVDPDSAGLPATVRQGDGPFRVYRRQLWMSLLSTYVAAPLREVFPGVSVTNWVVSVSRPDFPLLDWYNRPHPRSDIGLFTATNPIAYGNDIAYAYNRADSTRTQQAVDGVYTHILLRQVSADAYARSRDAPHLESVVWVSRYVRDIHDYESPIMSREAYRESLRHLWLRGTDAMMVFNPLYPGNEVTSLYEIEDAAAIYREMLAYADILSAGEVLNTTVPAPSATAVFWSGVRNADRAVIRLTNASHTTQSLNVSLWPGDTRVLEASPGGRTLLLTRP